MEPQGDQKLFPEEAEACGWTHPQKFCRVRTSFDTLGQLPKVEVGELQNLRVSIGSFGKWDNHRNLRTALMRQEVQTLQGHHFPSAKEAHKTHIEHQSNTWIIQGKA